MVFFHNHSLPAADSPTEPRSVVSAIEVVVITLTKSLILSQNKMLILTKSSLKGSLTSVTIPPRSYSEKAEVSQILKE